MRRRDLKGGSRQRLRPFVTAVAAAAVVLAGCGTPEDAETPADEGADADNDAPDGEAAQGGTLRVSVAANPSSLDPHAGSAGSDHQMLYTMFDTLVDMDFETGEPVPMLASD